MSTPRVTYTLGFKVFFNKAVTRKDLMSLCDEVMMSLNPDPFHPTVKVEPEPISEGGLVIRFLNIPRHYKSMRLHRRWCWPFITNSSVFEQWRFSDEVLLPASSRRESTFLKAFHGAPTWTLSELLIFKSAFEKLGGNVTGMPPLSSLSQASL